MPRSDCPISNILDHVGDRWSLLIIRDMALLGKSTYGEFLESAEGMATNILSSRLRDLEASKLVYKQRDPEDGRKSHYFLSDAGLGLLPVLVDMIVWSAEHDPKGLSVPAELVKRAHNDRAGLLSDLEARVRAQAF